MSAPDSATSARDAILSDVMASVDQSLPAFLDAVFGYLARQPQSPVVCGSEGIDVEHWVSGSLTRTRQAVRLQEAARSERDFPAPIVEDVALEVTVDTTQPDNTMTCSDSCCYYWSQTVEDVDVRVPVPTNVRKGKQVDVTISSQHVRVAVRGGGVLLAGPLHASVMPGDSLWDLTPAEHVTLHLAKKSAAWWPVEEAVVGVAGCVEGATQAERPLSSLPQHEQADIQRIMFDADQKALGRPTSNVLKAESMLRDAWDMDGSPFKGQPFDISKVNLTTSQ